MINPISKLKDRILNTISPRESESDYPQDYSEDYLEVDTQTAVNKSKITIRPFVLQEFTDIKPILEVLRDGYTIALINVKPLRDKDLIELKRAIIKIKKTCEAIDGDIAGFGEEWMCICPSFAKIHREPKAPMRNQQSQSQQQAQFEEYI